MPDTKADPHAVDVHVGKRIRHRRAQTGLTQQQLSEQIGCKFQQVQKYETGANRTSASRLYEIARAMGVTVSYFFEGLGGLDPVIDTIADDRLRTAYENGRTIGALNDDQRAALMALARLMNRDNQA